MVNTNWFQDEEWWKKYLATQIYSMWKEETDNEKKEEIKKGLEEHLKTIDDFNLVSSYDILSYLKVLGKEELKTIYIKNADGSESAAFELIKDQIDSKDATLNKDGGLIHLLQHKALLEAYKLAHQGDKDFDEAKINEQIKKAKESIETALGQVEVSSINDVLAQHYDNAEKSGAIEEISSNAKDSFLAELAKANGWDLVDGKKIESNDNALNTAIGTLEVYNSNGELNDIYSECKELLDKVKYEFPSGTSKNVQEAQTKAYNKLLLANATRRATLELLKDRSLLDDAKTNEAVLAKFKSMVAQQFERGVVLVGLAGNPKNSVLMQNIKRDKNGNVIYDDGSDKTIASDIQKILKGETKLSAGAINVDTWWLENIELPKAENIIKSKTDINKLTFLDKVKKAGAAAWDNVARKGGFKKILNNLVMFGGAAALMASPSGLAIATGAAIYAGWTTVNAWVMPIKDALDQEARNKNIKSLKDRYKYIKENWTRAKKAKYDEKDFTKRAKWRTAEGLVIGGLSGGMSAILGAGTWLGTFARQGTMATSKGGLFFRSLFNRKSAKKDIEKNGISVQKLQNLQADERYVKQDAIAFAAVGVGAVIGDGIKYDFQNNGVISRTYTDIKEAIGDFKENLQVRTSGSENQILNDINKEKTLTLHDSVKNNERIVSEASKIKAKIVTGENGAQTVLAVDEAGQPISVQYNAATGEYLVGGKVIAQNGDGGIKLASDTYQMNKASEIQAKIVTGENGAQTVLAVDEAGRPIFVQYNAATGEYLVGGKVIAQNGDGGIKLASDAQINGNIEPHATNVFQPYRDDATGKIVWKEPETENGITTTYMQDAQGRNYVRYEGLNTEHKPSESTYASLVNNINKKGNINFDFKDAEGNPVSFEDAVATMRTNLEGANYLPDGMSKEQAIFLAMMRARYIGKTDILQDILCGENLDNLKNTLTAQASLYATNPGYIGTLITDEPLQTWVGPTSKLELCQNSTPEQTNGTDIDLQGVKNYNVDFEDPYAELTSTYSSPRNNIQVDLDSLEDAEVMYGDKVNFTTGLRDNEITINNGTITGDFELVYHATHDIKDIINNLTEPTSVTIADDGVTTIVYEFEKGKTVSVVLDNASEEGVRTGHFLIGGKEVILDNESSKLMSQKLSESSTLGDYYSSVENDNVYENVPEGHERVGRRIENIAKRQEGPVVSDSTMPVDPNPATFTSTKLEEIKSKGEFVCIGKKGGRYILQINNVDGATKGSAPDLTHLNMDDATTTFTNSNDGIYKVTITTKDSKELVVSYNSTNNTSMATMNGKLVLLDTQTCSQVQNISYDKLVNNGVEVREVKLDTPFTTKVKQAIETYRSHQPVMQNSTNTR